MIEIDDEFGTVQTEREDGLYGYDKELRGEEGGALVDAPPQVKCGGGGGEGGDEGPVDGAVWVTMAEEGEEDSAPEGTEGDDERGVSYTRRTDGCATNAEGCAWRRLSRARCPQSACSVRIDVRRRWFLVRRRRADC